MPILSDSEREQLLENDASYAAKLAQAARPLFGGGQSSNYDFNLAINANLQEQSSDGAGVFEKRMKIRDTFIDAYTAYDSTCHGQDELVPVGSKCHNWVGMGLTIIDAVDTMYIMVYISLHSDVLPTHYPM